MKADIDDIGNPLVTIVIPAYNHEEYVRAAILSAVNQTYKNIEIIVINDGSTDNTNRVIRETISELSGQNIIYIDKENEGLTKTLNISLGPASGEYIQFLASDDAYLPEKTSICVEAISKLDKNIGAVYLDGFVINDNSERVMRFTDKYIRPISLNTYKELLLGNWIAAIGVLYRLDAIIDVGGFDESLAVEDYDLLLRISRKYRVVGLGQMGFLYRWHETNFSKDKKKMSDQFKLIHKKHADLIKYNQFRQAVLDKEILKILTQLTTLNLELLVRGVIRKLQYKYAIQNVSVFELISLISCKAFRRMKAELNAALANIIGIKIGNGSKIYGRINIIGNKRNINIGSRLVAHGDITIITTYSYRKDQITLGNDVVLDAGCKLHSLGGNLYIGNHCFVGSGVVVQANGDVRIGDYTMLAANSSLYANNHLTEDPDKPFQSQGNRFIGISVGNNCWIGQGVCVLDGTCIGDNSIVGAGCVLSGDYRGNGVIVAKQVIGSQLSEKNSPSKQNITAIDIN